MLLVPTKGQVGMLLRDKWLLRSEVRAAPVILEMGGCCRWREVGSIFQNCAQEAVSLGEVGRHGARRWY